MSTYAYQNALADVLETIPDVTWPDSVQTFAKMRTDPQLTAVLNAYTLPLRTAPKYVDPAGCRAEVVRMVADDLGLPVLGTKNVPGAARRRGVDFNEHFRIALLNLVFGHMPFAQRYEIVDGKARLVELAERMPSTITDILTDDAGNLSGILQFGEKDIIPARNLVWYCHEREGAAWHGRSMLRPAYGAWLLKHEMWRVIATSSRRFGMGVPIVNAPPGATDAQLRQAHELSIAIRSGEQAGAGLPNGFTYTLQGMTGSAPDTLAFTRYLDGQMAQMALASVLNLDASPNGSRALGETFVNLLLLSLNSVANEMATVLTKLAVQMVDYNFGEQENVPRIVIGDVGAEPEATLDAVIALIQAGAIVPDTDLENWVRERWNLPEKGEPEEVELPPVPGIEPEPEDEPPAPVAARRNRRVRAALPTGMRDLKPHEITATVDPAKLDSQWSTALESLVRNWTAISKAQREQITDQIAAAIDDNAIDRLAALAVDSSDAAQMLTDALETMATNAADEAAREAERQGVSVPEIDPDPGNLPDIASAVAAILASTYANAAGREAIRISTPGRTGADVADGVDDHLRQLSDSFLNDQLGNALSTAQNAGRLAVMSAAPAAKYFASEVLDKNTCKNCRAIDGEQFESLDEAAEAYASGGYTECLGRLRCRGIIVAVWDD
jgi:hypothetical protein